MISSHLPYKAQSINHDNISYAANVVWDALLVDKAHCQTLALLTLLAYKWFLFSLDPNIFGVVRPTRTCTQS